MADADLGYYPVTIVGIRDLKSIPLADNQTWRSAVAVFDREVPNDISQLWIEHGSWLVLNCYPIDEKHGKPIDTGHATDRLEVRVNHCNNTMPAYSLVGYRGRLLIPDFPPWAWKHS